MRKSGALHLLPWPEVAKAVMVDTAKDGCAWQALHLHIHNQSHDFQHLAVEGFTMFWVDEDMAANRAIACKRAGSHAAGCKAGVRRKAGGLQLLSAILKIVIAQADGEGCCCKC